MLPDTATFGSRDIVRNVGKVAGELHLLPPRPRRMCATAPRRTSAPTNFPGGRSSFSPDVAASVRVHPGQPRLVQPSNSVEALPHVLLIAIVITESGSSSVLPRLSPNLRAAPIRSDVKCPAPDAETGQIKPRRGPHPDRDLSALTPWGRLRFR